MKTELDTKNKLNFKNKFFSNNTNFEKETTSFKYKGLKFNWLYRNIKLKYKFLIVSLAAMTMGVITLFFIQNTGLYSPGISSFAQGMSRFTSALMLNHHSDITIEITSKILFYLFSAFVNIPGLIFAYKKIGVQFAMLTMNYVIFSTIFPFLLSLIPNINSIQIFGNVTSQVFEVMPSGSFTFLLWSSDNSKVISLIFFAIGYSILASIPLTFCYVIGASAGGFDVIAIYLMKKKRKQLGSVFLINNLIILTIAAFFGTFLSVGIVGAKNPIYSNQYIVENFFSPNFLCTIILVFTFSTILNKIYPRFKLIGIKITSAKKYKLDEKMFGKNFNHARLISYGVGGFKKEEQEIITIYCFIFEVHEIISRAKKINKNSFITVDESVSVEGSITYNKFLF